MRQHIDSELGANRGPEWTVRPERSNTNLIRFIVWIALTLGRPAARILLYPTTLYFLVFSSPARNASSGFLRRALGREPSITDSFRHFHCFSATLLDRVFLLNDQYERFDVRIHGAEIIENMMARGEGCFLLGAHLGSFEIVRSLAREAGNVRVSMVMYEDNASKVNSVLSAINPDLSIDIIPLGKPDSMLRVREALEGGGCIGMLGDRSIAGEGSVSRVFFGEHVCFPAGPFRVAAMLKRPMILMFGLYLGGNRYDIHFEHVVDFKQVGRENRENLMEASQEKYIARLEHYCRAAPYNWFNFYDFWK